MALLKAKEIRVRFGGLLALADVSFSLLPGEIVGLIGPNGAGKTTVFNVITGVYKTSGGDVQYENQSLLGKRPHEILSLGIARTFQTIRLFNNMTAVENAMVAQFGYTRNVIHQCHALGRIHPGGRFIQKHYFGLRGQGSGDFKPSL